MNADISIIPYQAERTEDYDVVSYVYQSENYDIFKTYASNREPDHYELIRQNILKNGYISNPIITTRDRKNGGLTIIDGYNRFLAQTNLGLPISFVILEGACEKDMVTLNIVSKKWTSEDFVHFYASEGKEDYKIIEQFKRQYPDFCLTAITCVLSDIRDGSGLYEGGVSKIASGSFKVADTEKCRFLLDWFVSLKGVNNSTFYNNLRFVQSVVGISRNESINLCQLRERIKKTPSLFIKQINSVGYTNMLETIYNYGIREKNRIKFK